jgi:hypothetical protein
MVGNAVGRRIEAVTWCHPDDLPEGYQTTARGQSN